MNQFLTPGDINNSLSSSQIKELAAGHAYEVINSSESDLLSVFVELKRYEHYIKSLINEIKTNTKTDESVRTVKINNAIVKYSVVKKWDFSSNSSWKAANEEFLEAKYKRTWLEKQLKKSNEDLIKQGFT